MGSFGCDGSAEAVEGVGAARATGDDDEDGAETDGTVTAEPQLLHVALRPANSGGTEKGRLQPGQLNWIMD